MNAVCVTWNSFWVAQPGGADLVGLGDSLDPGWGGASAVDGQELRPVSEVGLVREDRLSFSVVFDHDDWLSRADRVTAVEAGGV